MTVSLETLQQRIGSEIDPGERVLRVGAPDPAKRAASGIPLLLFGIPFTLFAVFWTTTAGRFTALFSGVVRSADNGPGTSSGPGAVFAAPFLLFPLFGLIFVVIGINLLLAPLWAYLRAQRTVYAITDRRAITVEANALGGGRAVRSYGPGEIAKMERRESAQGVGDLIFSRERYSTYHNGQHRSRTRENGFFAIADTHAVERILRDTFLGGGYR
ncbi:MAG: hypothetical protein H7Z41_12950 [Cytophagales bacterium]|nr:hypothetical protein [Armatimonadota bacterium]